MIDVLVSRSLPGWFGIITNELGAPDSCKELFSPEDHVTLLRVAKLARETSSSPALCLLSGRKATGCKAGERNKVTYVESILNFTASLKLILAFYSLKLTTVGIPSDAYSYYCEPNRIQSLNLSMKPLQ